MQKQANSLRHLFTLIDVIDLTCYLQANKRTDAMAKMKILQATTDNFVDGEKSNERENGLGKFCVTLERSHGGATTVHTGGIFEKASDGRDMLTFVWLDRRHLLTLSHFLCGVTCFLNNTADKDSHRHLSEALRNLEGKLRYILAYLFLMIESFSDDLKVENAPKASMYETQNRVRRNSTLEWLIKFHLIFISCCRKDWDGAKVLADNLEETTSTFLSLNPQVCIQLTTYLNGIIAQGRGDLEAAVVAYQSPVLALPETINPSVPDFSIDIRILAALNTVWIVQEPSHPQHFMRDLLITTLETLCTNHPNRSIKAAYDVTVVVSASDNSIIKRKNYLSTALNAARDAANDQLKCICLTLLSASFFRDSVGEQAEKSVTVAKQLAKQWGEPAWMAISAELCVSMFERNGKWDRMQEAQVAAQEAMKRLPMALRQT
jgi:hypothetical protein